MDEELKKKLAEQDAKLDAIFRSAEATRKYFKWTLIITLVTIVLPLIGILFLAPVLLNYYSNLGSGMGF